MFADRVGLLHPVALRRSGGLAGRRLLFLKRVDLGDLKTAFVGPVVAHFAVVLVERNFLRVRFRAERELYSQRSNEHLNVTDLAAFQLPGVEHLVQKRLLQLVELETLRHSVARAVVAARLAAAACAAAGVAAAAASKRIEQNSMPKISNAQSCGTSACLVRKGAGGTWRAANYSGNALRDLDQLAMLSADDSADESRRFSTTSTALTARRYVSMIRGPAAVFTSTMSFRMCRISFPLTRLSCVLAVIAALRWLVQLMAAFSALLAMHSRSQPSTPSSVQPASFDRSTLEEARQTVRFARRAGARRRRSRASAIDGNAFGHIAAPRQANWPSEITRQSAARISRTDDDDARWNPAAPWPCAFNIATARRNSGQRGGRMPRRLRQRWTKRRPRRSRSPGRRTSAAASRATTASSSSPTQHGNIPPMDEYEIVAQHMEMVGRAESARPIPGRPNDRRRRDG